MSRTTRRLAAAGGAAAAVAAVTLAGGSAQAATCSSTFRVLHNDRIGALQLPAGSYRIRTTGMSCSQASALFPVFLNDYDGRLPGGWAVTNRGSGNGQFTRGGRSFTVQRLGSGGGGNGPADLTCARLYRSSGNVDVGLLRLVRDGRYRITRLSPISPTCGRARTLLGRWTGDDDQVLGGGWVSLPVDGTYVRGASSYGFRVELVGLGA